jgi:hypothetical protein
MPFYIEEPVGNDHVSGMFVERNNLSIKNYQQKE